MLEQVRATIKKYNMLAPGDRVLTGVSAGPDSVALVHMLSSVAHDFGIKIYIAHLNHCFRGQDSLDDAEFVRGLSKRLGLEALIESRDVSRYIAENRLSKQAGAREVRYRFFEEAAKRFGCNKIATGHNANDQAETILSNFLRGSGPAGMSGIPPVRDGVFIRPLIEVPRDAIDRYCIEQQLSPRIDKSNLKNVYKRNRIRLELIPYLEKEYNSNLVETLVRTGEIFREEEKYLQEETVKFWKKAVEKENHGEVVFTREVFLNIPGAIQKRMIRYAWGLVTGSVHNLEHVHMLNAIHLIKSDGTGSALNLPMRVVLSKEYNRVTLSSHGYPTPENDFSGDLRKSSWQEEYSYQLKIPGITFIPETGDAIEVLIDSNNNDSDYGVNEILLDMDSVVLPLTVRNRRAGDWFKPTGFDGSKKLKKYLIDSKVPRRERDLLPIVISAEGSIIWVAGLRADRRWNVNPGTKHVLRLKLMRNSKNKIENGINI